MLNLNDYPEELGLYYIFTPLITCCECDKYKYLIEPAVLLVIPEA